MIVSPGRYRFGPNNGRLLLYTRRQGVAGSLGHDLTIEATTWSAEAEVGDDSSSGHLIARVDLASLTVVEGRGGAMPLTSDNRREIEKNARKALDVGRFPEAVFESTVVTQAGPEGGVHVEGMLTLRGKSAAQRLHVEQTDEYGFHARATVVQTKLGIKPYSAFFGALKLRDEVEVQVEVQMTRGADPG